MVVPSCAVTTVVMVVMLPSAPKATAPDAVPDATAMPFTFIVALASWVVAVTVTDVVALAADVV